MFFPVCLIFSSFFLMEKYFLATLVQMHLASFCKYTPPRTTDRRRRKLYKSKKAKRASAQRPTREFRRCDFRKNAQKAVRIVQLFAVMLGKMKILQLQAGQRNSVLCLCQWSLLIPYTGSVWISKKAKNGPRFQTSQKKTFI